MGADQSTVEVDILGGRVRVPVTPCQLTSATGAPVVVIFPNKSGPGNSSLQVAKVIRALVRSVEERPCRFFNFFDKWNQEPMR